MDIWKPGTVFMRHIDKDGRGYIESHQCWNTERFIESAVDAAEKAGGSVQIITATDYQSQRWQHGLR